MEDHVSAQSTDTDNTVDEKIFQIEGYTTPPEVQRLADLINTHFLPPELYTKVARMLEGLVRRHGSPGYDGAFDEISRYIDWVIAIPWKERSQDNLDLDKARTILETTHFGLDSVKERVLEYLAVINLQLKSQEDAESQAAREEITRQGAMASPVLFFVGLPGIGKTSIAYTIAKAMNREFQRIPMGGMGDALQLRGTSRLNGEAEPGLIIKALVNAKTKNPVILLDEIDRTAEQARAQIMGVLLELLDPQQNFAFRDYFVDFPVDLSEVMFLASANNTGGISNAVLDRMELIKMPGYSDDEKIVIARDYLLPRQLKVTGMPSEAITFDEEVWEQITRPLGFDAGIRTMERTINAIVRKAAKKMVLGQGQQFQITKENIKEYLPKF